MQRDRQLDHAEPGPQMPAGNADGVNHFGAQLIGQRAQFIRLKPPEIGRRDYAIEQRRDWTAFPACHQWISLFALPVLYATRSEEHTSELQSLMRISYAVFCLKKKIIIFHLS